ncbi:MAG: lysophospholipid acyltransferase family protein [Desulfobulbaceae bacterium]|nr:lysophospholipid acyltransferase family protein [Desulfobulbaceae bacterium]
MKLKKRILHNLEKLGHFFFYLALFAGGQRMAYLLLYPVIFVYVLFSSRIRRETAGYLQKRFPDHSKVQLWRDTFYNVMEFGRILVDRGWIGLKKKSGIHGIFDNSQQLLDLVKDDKGVVVLLAHVGNWQTGFADLGRLETKVHSLMEYDPDTVSKHYFDLGGKRNFSIIDARGFMGGMVEATTVLQRGEVVLIMADRYVAGPATEVDFLGQNIKLPLAPFGLAARTGASIAFLFAAKTGRSSYELRIWDVIKTNPETRADTEILKGYAQRYATSLEKYVQKYPYQWFNFYDIWKKNEE